MNWLALSSGLGVAGTLGAVIWALLLRGQRDAARSDVAHDKDLISDRDAQLSRSDDERKRLQGVINDQAAKLAEQRALISEIVRTHPDLGPVYFERLFGKPGGQVPAAGSVSPGDDAATNPKALLGDPAVKLP